MRTRKRVKKEKSSERNLLPVAVGGGRALTAREFQGLADVPAEEEWFANIDNRQTRRAYQNGIKDFMTFVEKLRLRAVVYFVIVNVLVVKSRRDSRRSEKFPDLRIHWRAAYRRERMRRLGTVAKQGPSEAHGQRPARTIHPAMQPMWSTWSHPIRRIGRSVECSHFLKCLINHQTGTRVSTKMWRRAKVTPPTHPRIKPNSTPWMLPCIQAAGCESRSFLTAIHSFWSSQSAIR